MILLPKVRNASTAVFKGSTRVESPNKFNGELFGIEYFLLKQSCAKNNEVIQKSKEKVNDSLAKENESFQEVESTDNFLAQALPQLNEADVEPFLGGKLDKYNNQRGTPWRDKVEKRSHYFADVARNKLCFTEFEAKLIMDFYNALEECDKNQFSIINLHQNHVQQRDLEWIVQDTIG